MSINDIIINGQKEGKTIEEINAELKANGYTTILTDGTKTGNAVLVMGSTNIEIVTVKEGKLVNGAGAGSADYVIYLGTIYHTEDDGVTLVPGYPEAHGKDTSAPLKDVDKSRHPEWAGRNDIIQKTVKGTFMTSWDENGYFVKAVRV